MKDYIKLMCIFLSLLIFIPCISYLSDNIQETDSDESLSVKMLFEESGEVRKMPLKEYIVGAVFAQMPADFEEEALKAQAVLASTYIRRRIANEEQSATSSLMGAYISDDSTKYQAFFTEAQAREVYNDKYDTAYERISKAADYAEHLTLCYDEEPILVAFHGISFGKTESAQSVWGKDIPYLTSADSSWDSTLDECENTVTISKAQMKKLLSGEFTGETLSEEPELWITVAEKTESGTVLKVKIGNGLYDSSRLCELLGLVSAHFTIDYSNDCFTVMTWGCGHLVGMSQYGANEMAKSGSDCEEILLHYFKGTSLVRY